MRTNAIVDEILAKHLPKEVFHTLSSEVKAGIDKSIREALVVGEISGIASAGKPMDALSRSIAIDAAAFETSLRLPTPPVRVRSSVYPWHWCYIDDDLQEQFRDFVRNAQVATKSKESPAVQKSPCSIPSTVPWSNPMLAGTLS